MSQTGNSSDVTTVITHGHCVLLCFAPFQGDDEVEDWVQRACKRWLHEECMNKIVYDKYCREHFCPHALLTVNQL